MSREEKTTRSNARKSRVVKQNTNRAPNGASVSKNADWASSTKTQQRRNNRVASVAPMSTSRKVSGQELNTGSLSSNVSNTVWGKKPVTSSMSMSSVGSGQNVDSSHDGLFNSSTGTDRTDVSVRWIQHMLDHMDVFHTDMDDSNVDPGIGDKYLQSISPLYSLFNSTRTSPDALHARARLLVLLTWHVNQFCSLPSSQQYLQSLASKVSFHCIEKPEDPSEKLFFWCVVFVSGSTASGLASNTADIDTGIQFISIPESRLQDFLTTQRFEKAHSSKLVPGLEYLPGVWGDFKGTTVPYNVSSSVLKKLGSFLEDPFVQLQQEDISLSLKVRLDFVQNRVHRRHWFQTTVYEYASTPLVKLRFEEAGLEVDICTVDSVGIQCANLLRAIHHLDPRTMPFIMAVKNWAQRQMLNDAYNNSIPSVGWVYLCLSFLMYVEPRVGTKVDVTNFAPQCGHISLPKKPNVTLDTATEYVDEMMAKLLPLETLLSRFFQHYYQFDFSNLAVYVGAMADAGAGLFHAERLAQRYACYKQWVFTVHRHNSSAEEHEEIDTIEYTVLDRIGENQQWTGCVCCDSVIRCDEPLYALRHTCDVLSKDSFHPTSFTHFSQYLAEAEECLVCHLSRAIPLSQPDLVGLRYMSILKAQKIIFENQIKSKVLLPLNVFQPLEPVFHPHMPKNCFIPTRKFAHHASNSLSSPMVVMNAFVPFTSDVQPSTPMNTPASGTVIHIPARYLSWIDCLERINLDTLFLLNNQCPDEELVQYHIVEHAGIKIQLPSNICRVVTDNSCTNILNKFCESNINMTKTLDIVKNMLIEVQKGNLRPECHHVEDEKKDLPIDYEPVSTEDDLVSPYVYPFVFPSSFFLSIRPVLYEGVGTIYSSILPNQPSIDLLIHESLYRIQVNQDEELNARQTYRSVVNKHKNIDKILFEITSETKIPFVNAAGYTVNADMDPLLTLLTAVASPPIAAGSTLGTEENVESAQEFTISQPVTSLFISPINAVNQTSENMLHILSTVKQDEPDTDMFVPLVKLLCPQMQTFTTPNLFK